MHVNRVVYALQIIDPTVAASNICCRRNSSGAVHGHLEIIGLVIDATLRRISLDRPSVSLVVERDGARIPVYRDVAGEGGGSKTVSRFILGKQETVCYTCLLIGRRRHWTILATWHNWLIQEVSCSHAVCCTR